MRIWIVQYGNPAGDIRQFSETKYKVLAEGARMLALFPIKTVYTATDGCTDGWLQNVEVISSSRLEDFQFPDEDSFRYDR